MTTKEKRLYEIENAITCYKSTNNRNWLHHAKRHLDELIKELNKGDYT